MTMSSYPMTFGKAKTLHGSEKPDGLPDAGDTFHADGKSLLIFGAGPVGLWTAWLALREGARSVVVAERRYEPTSPDGGDRWLKRWQVIEYSGDLLDVDRDLAEYLRPSECIRKGGCAGGIRNLRQGEGARNNFERQYFSVQHFQLMMRRRLMDVYGGEQTDNGASQRQRFHPVKAGADMHAKDHDLPHVNLEDGVPGELDDLEDGFDYVISDESALARRACGEEKYNSTSQRQRFHFVKAGADMRVEAHDVAHMSLEAGVPGEVDDLIEDGFDYVIDATGASAAIMHQLLKVPIDVLEKKPIHYGSAFKLTWNQHELFSRLLKCECGSSELARDENNGQCFEPTAVQKNAFHDCRSGFSSKAMFAPFVMGQADVLADAGFKRSGFTCEGFEKYTSDGPNCADLHATPCPTTRAPSTSDADAESDVTPPPSPHAQRGRRPILRRHHTCHGQAPHEAKPNNSLQFANVMPQYVPAKQARSDGLRQFLIAMVAVRKELTTVEPYSPRTKSESDLRAIYEQGVEVLKYLKASPMPGAKASGLIERLALIPDFPGARITALRLREIVEDRELTDPFDLVSTHADQLAREFLDEVYVSFVPERTERILEHNYRRNVVLKINGGPERQVTEAVFAIGDSLFSTDFRIGQGVNRGLSSATQLVVGCKNPEQIRREACARLPKFPPLTLAGRERDARRTREWLLAEAAPLKTTMSQDLTQVSTV